MTALLPVADRLVAEASRLLDEQREAIRGFDEALRAEDLAVPIERKVRFVPSTATGSRKGSSKPVATHAARPPPPPPPPTPTRGARTAVTGGGDGRRWWRRGAIDARALVTAALWQRALDPQLSRRLDAPRRRALCSTAWRAARSLARVEARRTVAQWAVARTAARRAPLARSSRASRRR